MPNWLPGKNEIIREAIIVMAGALLATLVVKYVIPEQYRDNFTLTK